MINNLHETTGYKIRNVSLLLVNKINQNFQKEGFDITADQLKMLVVLWDKDGKTQNELGESIGRFKTSVTKLVDGLEKRKLIRRVQDPTDRRSNLVYLTKLGKNIRKQLLPIIEKTLDEAHKSISEDKLMEFHNVLDQIESNLM
ncbi:DNA-binding transcriptional regulator, MarR family [Maribacter dokdonensis]|uniref:DNA-binding transcriptional regulator, MarR family n=1 Tax=Maribacter dokdonensis TaxID=320912 RepID=A0ABY0UMS2_9FLAO|nr:MarR family transcriptional regulator [Maribacter dokdonensis]SDS92855.1 DNA-binding transcriptional regulator, MarR family [Maribacter dokdonensis]